MLRAGEWDWRRAPGGCTCTHLLVSDVVRVRGGGLLHGHQTQHLQEVVLHHVPGGEAGASWVRGLQVGSEPALDPSPLARFWGRRGPQAGFSTDKLQDSHPGPQCLPGALKERKGDSDPLVATNCSDTAAKEFELGVGREQPPTTGRGDPAGRWIAPRAHVGLLGGGHRLSPDDPKFIKVAPAALSTEGLLEGEDDAGDIVPVPDGAEDPVGKPGGVGQRLVAHPTGSSGVGRASRARPGPGAGRTSAP